MSIAISTHMEQQIINIIKRFKFEELESSVMPIFIEISWTNIKSQLVKYHKSFTTVNVAQLIKKAIREINLPEKVWTDRLLTLKLLEISWHNKRITWYGYTFTDINKSTNYLINREIQNNMQNSFHSVNLKITVKVITHNGITYVALFESGRRSKKKKYVSAMYLALFMGQKYFFSTRRYISSNILNVIVNCLGYQDSKRLKLMGKDLRSLSKLCWKKMEGALNCNTLNKTSVYKDAAPNIKKTGIDFTQQHQRKRYSEICFGNDPPTLELLVLNGPNMPVVHKDIIKEIPNESICATWEFRSHNIVKCLRKLIEQRILVTPLPYYISNLMVLGKNEITLKTN